MDRSWIDRYVAGANAVSRAIEGLTRQQLLACPIPGTWSIQQIVLHLMDSDLVGADRMKRIIAENHPTLISSDQDAFVARLGYEDQDAAAAAEIFRLNRLLFGEVLRRQPDEVFDRTGYHNEDGVVVLGDMVGKYVEHLEHHLGFLRKKRELMI
jgi:hypothetical protein